MRHIHWADLYTLEPAITGRQLELGRLYRSERLYITREILNEDAIHWQQFIKGRVTSIGKEPTMKIRRKTDHTIIVEVEEVLCLELDKRWREDNPRKGTITYFSDREWEEVPAERWKIVYPSLANDGKRLFLDQLSTEPCGFPQRTTFQLPDGYRFAPCANGFIIEKKIS